MRKKIEDLLQKTAQENEITILFATESGSRAWGMASRDSDYDIRFVYCRKLEDYITLSPRAEVITAAYDANMEPCEVQGSLFDMCGFDIFKYLKLLSASNPTAIEWLLSPIVYCGNKDVSLEKYIAETFSPQKLFYHYFSLFKSNYQNFILTDKKVTYKVYLYAMRGLVNAGYVRHFDKLPPLDFRQTVNEYKPLLPQEIYNRLTEVICIKSAGGEKEHIARIPEFDAFFAEAFCAEAPVLPQRQPEKEVLESYLRRCLL